MKKLLLLLFKIFTVLIIQAQVPGEINYQGVARNSGGVALANQDITLRISIRNTSTTGSIVYQETRKLKTNSFGLFTVAIGSTGATNTSGSINAINWSDGNRKFVQVEIDPSAGYAFKNMGAAQLLSVPYALYAETAAPKGAAGGSLKGNYPNPTLGNGVVTTETLSDGSVTNAKLADESVTTAKIGTGAVTSANIADASVTNTKIADASVSANKLQDAAVTSAKIADAAVTSGKINDGSVTSAKLADGAVTNNKISNGSVTTAKISDGAVTTVKIGDGSVTSAKIADAAVTSAKINDASVTSAKIADGAVATSKISDGSVTTAKIAAGAVTDIKLSDNSVTSTKIVNGAVTNGKIADDAISTAKVQDGSITLAKLAPGVAAGGSQPTGQAGGDLNGNYPDPSIASQAVTTSKIANGAVVTPKLADGAVTTNKIADGSVTAAKLAAGVIPTTAGGDLSGTYPNPLIGKLQGVTLSNNAPATGQVLKYDGTKWAPGADNLGTFTLPYSTSQNSATNLFSVTNQGAGLALEGINSSTSANVNAIYGKISATTPAANATAVRGAVTGSGAEGFGVWGSHAANGTGVYGTTVNGDGVSGKATGGNGVFGTSVNGLGVFGTSDNGVPGLFSISNTNNFNDALFATNAGFANGVVGLSTYSNGVLGIANDIAGAGIFGINNAGGEGVVGRAFSDFAAAVVGRNDGTFAGVKAVSAAMNGVGMLAQANVDGSSGGTALVAELEGNSSGNLAVFKANGANVARIDNTGKGYFNNNIQVGGADVAEYFAVEGNRNNYEPGDVLVISQNSDRTIEKSSGAYSTLVSGVYATKAGLLLTEENAVENNLDNLVPMGVIGVIPTKVNLEGGSIKRGDMLVTSSTQGVAMKGDPDKIRIGQVIGKALQDYNAAGIGKINVLVSIK